MCFVDFGKAYNLVPWGLLSGLECRVPGLLLKSFCPCMTKVRVVSLFSAQTQICSQWVLDSAKVAPCPDSVCDIHGRELKGSWGEDDVQFANFRTASTECCIQAGSELLPQVSGVLSHVMRKWSMMLVQHLQYCGCCTELLWGRGS